MMSVGILICSEVTPEGIKETELGQTLVNGNHIAMVKHHVVRRSNADC